MSYRVAAAPARASTAFREARAQAERLQRVRGWCAGRAAGIDVWPRPPKLGPQVTCMAKKKGVRLIVTIEVGYGVGEASGAAAQPPEADGAA
jgi:hypothetical protein